MDRYLPDNCQGPNPNFPWNEPEMQYDDEFAELKDLIVGLLCEIPDDCNYNELCDIADNIIDAMAEEGYL